MSRKRNPLPFLAFVLFISLFLTSCGQAGVINVGCDVDDLIDAINVANNDGVTTRLILSPNCTYPITSVDNTAGGAGPNGLPQITTNIKIEGNNAVLTKQHAFGNRYFFITASGNLVLEDLTLEKGYAFAGDFPETRGGAVYNDGGAFRAERSIFRDNHAPQGHGGAIYNLGLFTLKETFFDINFSNNGGAIYNGGNQSDIVVLEDVTFENNGGLDNGGAIYNISPEADILITGSTFYSNSSYEFHGGAIYMEAGELNISNCEFLENRAGNSSGPTGDGGAIYSASGELTLVGTNLYQQRALGYGGSLYVGPNSELRLIRSRIEDSGACHDGGGIYLEGQGEILQSTLDDIFAGGTETYWGNTDPWTSLGCTDPHGGAIFNSGTLTLDQSLIVDSRAWGEGDGIYNSGDLTIINNTFHADPAYTNFEAINNHGNASLSFSTLMNAALYNSSTMTVKNIAIVKHSNACVNSGNFVVLDENATMDPACLFSMTFTHPWEFDLSYTLSDNGGPTLTHFLQDDSPLIDMATCSSVSGDQVFKDQRDLHRPFPLNNICDIGAFEKREYATPIAPPPPPAPPGGSSDCDPFAGQEIRVITLGVDPDTLVFPVYLRFSETVPYIGDDGTMPYWGRLGSFESYLANQQGFPNRAYFMFKLTPTVLGSALDLAIFKDGCEDHVFFQPNLSIPGPSSGVPDQEDDETTCQADLGESDCEDAGGFWFTGVDDPYCLCP